MAALLRYGSTIGLHPEYLCAQVDTMPFASREQLGFSFFKNSKKEGFVNNAFLWLHSRTFGRAKGLNSSVACWRSLYSPVPVNLIL